MRRDVRFASGAGQCSGSFHPALGEDLLTRSGRPCVVMAHGSGATRDCSLEGFAERFCEAGLNVLTFAYRRFGGSEGETPLLMSLRGQRAEYHAAIAHARSMEGVDSTRIVVWGVALSGGQVFRVAAEDPEVAAVIAVTPAPDGVASMRNLLRSSNIRTAARFALTAGLDRPVRFAKRIHCPMLVQVADHDRTAPPEAARRAAWLARADVRGYPCDHFDVYPGMPWFDTAVEHQILFLRRHLGRQHESARV